MIVYGNVFEHCVVTWNDADIPQVIAVLATQKLADELHFRIRHHFKAGNCLVMTLNEYERDFCQPIDGKDYIAKIA